MHDIYSVQYCTRTNVLSIWYNQTLWRWLFRLSPRVEHFRKIDEEWYYNNTFKPVKPLKCYYVQRLYLSLMKDSKSLYEEIS